MDTTTNKSQAKKSNREKIYEKIDERTKVISNPTTVHETITFIEKGFPKSLFKQWRKKCKEDFNDIYYLKMWTDHLKAEAYDKIIASAIEVVQQPPVQADESKQENESQEPVVFGGGE